MTRRLIPLLLVAALLSPTAPRAFANASPPDLLAEMTAIVDAAHQPALAADRAALGADTARQAAAVSRQAADTAAAASAAARATAASTALTAAAAELAAAAGARQAADGAVAADRVELAAVAVELYTNPAGPGGSAEGSLDLAQAQAAAEARGLLGAVTSGEETRLRADVVVASAAQRREADDTTRVRTATDALARAQRLRDNAAAVLGPDAAAVASAASAVAGDGAALQADTAARAAALAAVAQPPGAPVDGSPTVLGGAALTAAQIEAWYRSGGWVDLTPAPIGQLAAWYLSEGAAEGVRGDVAFAQAMVETGGFSSPDASLYSNFAGIGHCDSCGAGYGFTDPLMGVRGQIQLLRGFADATLTTARLANPPPLPSLRPETEPLRGCCATFQSLTGHWASDPLYGSTVMRVYRSMLERALSPRQAPQSG